jgi:hypothetical protein
MSSCLQNVCVFFLNFGLGAAAAFKPPQPLGVCLMQAALLFVAVLTFINFLHII